uniref:Uncharacterized protein n=1 Tax=Siphoviridae sp. ct3Mm15 TaxID=2827558 RepID=A0A8S5RT77_9CAUD|nr:MAG TPA: hypothetical protein [Siphoviridae sp. ct3Mm15]
MRRSANPPCAGITRAVIPAHQTFYFLVKITTL